MVSVFITTNHNYFFPIVNYSLQSTYTPLFTRNMFTIVRRTFSTWSQGRPSAPPPPVPLDQILFDFMDISENRNIGLKLSVRAGWLSSDRQICDRIVRWNEIRWIRVLIWRYVFIPIVESKYFEAKQDKLVQGERSFTLWHQIQYRQLEPEGLRNFRYFRGYHKILVKVLQSASMRNFNGAE